MSMFNFGYNRRPTGLFSQLDDPANIAAIAQRRVPTAMPQEDEEERRRRGSGLLSNLGLRIFGDDNRFFGRQDDGTTFRDRMMMAGMALGGDARGAMAYRQGLQQANAERQQIYALEDQYGLQRGSLAMLPREAQQRVVGELAARRFTPEEPDLPSSVREYEYAQQQGFQGSFQDWQAANPRGTQFTVNTGDGPAQDGDILEVRGDSVLIRDSSQPNGFRLEPISGGDTAYDRAEDERQRQGRQQSRERYGGVVLDSIERAEDLLLDPENDFITGRAGQALAFINPESEAGTFESVLGDIQSNIGFDRLGVMRENSPTGGAVGQLSDPERRALQRTLGDLSNARNPEVILRNLAQVRNAYLDALYGTPQRIRDAVARGDLGEDALQYAERVDPDQYASERMTGRAIADGQVPQGARAMVGPNGQRGYEVNGIIYDERGRIVGRGGR